MARVDQSVDVDQYGQDERDQATGQLEAFQELLTDLGLSSYYPNKLSLQEVTEVRFLQSAEENSGDENSGDGCSDDGNLEELPFSFLGKLTSLDTRVVLSENLPGYNSVRDMLFALYHCSDNHLRQHFTEKLAACQLAVTVLLPDITGKGKPLLLLWALRRIVKKWRDDAESVAPEKRMVSEPVFTAAFVRLGEIPISKSMVLNNVMGRAQGNETFRFFLTSKEDEYDAEFAKGSVEAQWYLPMHGRCGEIIKQVTLLLNLRGDARSYPLQSDVACKVSNIVFVFVRNTSYDKYKQEIESLMRKNPNVRVIRLRERQRAKSRRQPLGKHEVRENEMLCDVGRDENVNLSKLVCKQISESCSETDRDEFKPIETWYSLCSDKIDLDEDNEDYCQAAKLLQHCFPSQDKTIKNIKTEYLTLQKEWLEWVEADQISLKATEQVDIQLDRRNEKQKKIRMKQLANGLSKGMNKLLESFQFVLQQENKNMLHYFMALFQTFIDELVSHEIPDLIRKLDQTNSDIEQEKEKLKLQPKVGSIPLNAQGNKIVMLQRSLLEITEEFTARSITCEHFIRELGHLFEANREINVISNDEIRTLTNIAAQLLMHGYPLEIMDGESAYIPIKWIRGVLQSVQTLLHNPKIFVLSIIGIQSSGKSTLLNSMFGVRFPVRAGRCTRGLYLQLLKIHENYREAVGFQYLLIMDTEGLQSPDRTVKNDYKFDNTIATLAMCIGDLTLLNIGQETIGNDMIGILQIVAHALIRMKQVELVSHCQILQQRVSDIAAAKQNKANMAKIKAALDKATVTAAKEEHVEEIEGFGDIFPLIQEDDLQFFPCLWTGHMAPPNAGYSDKIHALKYSIFLQTGRQGTGITPQFTMAKFISRLMDVWEAVKKEDFVFNFQNSFDALSNRQFRLEHSKLIGKMRTNMVAWELNIKMTELTENNKSGFYTKLGDEIGRQCETVNGEVDKYVELHRDEEEVKRRQESVKTDTTEVGKGIERAIKSNVDYFLETQKTLGDLPNFLESAKAALRKAAKSAADRLRVSNPNLNLKTDRKVLKGKFEELWKIQSEELEERYSKVRITPKQIREQCDSSISQLMKDNFLFQAYLDVHNNPRSRPWWSKAKNVYRKLRGEEEKQQKYRVELDNVLQKHQMELRNNGHGKPFSQITVDRLLNQLFTDLKAKGLDDHFIAELLITAETAILKTCQEIQRKNEEEFSLPKLFQDEKELLEMDFYGFFDKTIRTEAAAQRLYTDFMSIIQQKVIDGINVEILDKMRSENCYNDKQLMIGKILDELCRGRDQEGYYKFIDQNRAFIETWLQEKVVKLVISNRRWINEIAMKLINEPLKAIEAAVQNSCNHFKLLLEHGRITEVAFSDWKNIFLGDSAMKSPLNEYKFTEASFKLSDIEYFSTKISNLFRERLTKDLKDNLQFYNVGNKVTALQLIQRMKRDIGGEILDHLQVCNEVCPFCMVNCHLQIGGEHMHKALLHYPQGLAGFRDIPTQELTTESCTLLVASEQQYKFGDDVAKNYKDYRNQFSNWDITPIRDDKPIEYWRWVLKEFNNFFAAKRNAQPADIPDGWGSLTQAQALQSLKDHYKIGE